MSSNSQGSLSGAKIVVASRVDRDSSCIHLVAPSPGIWRNHPIQGSIVQSGQFIGELEVLGRRSILVAPPNAFGQVVAAATLEGSTKGQERYWNSLHRPVQYGDILLTLDPQKLGEGITDLTQGSAAAEGSSGLYVRSPSSGRFYSRPGPGRAPFVQVGELVDRGQTVAMLEVMKTFTRIQLLGEELPDKVRVTAVFVQDEDELAAGDVILEYETIEDES